MPSIMENNAQVAALNPNIQTPLVGAKPSQPLRPPTQAFPSAQQAQQQIQSAIQPIAQAGQAATAPIGANAEQMMQQLFSYDQQLESGQSPFPQVPGYVENPADLYRGGAAFAGGMAQNYGAATGVISNINQAYTNAMDKVSNSILEFYRTQEDARSRKEERDNEFLRWILDRTGGKVTNPVTGEVVDIPKPTTGAYAAGGGQIDFNALLDEYAGQTQGVLAPAPTLESPNTPLQQAQGPSNFGEMLGIGKY